MACHTGDILERKKTKKIRGGAGAACSGSTIGGVAPQPCGARGQRRDSPAGRCRVPCQRVAHRAEAISSSGPEEVLLARRRARQDAVHG